MDMRNGPRLARRDMLQEQLVPIYKADFLPRSVLIAPPIIFQTRVQHSVTCPYSYSSTFIQEQHTRVVSGKCAPPYLCTDSVLTHPESTVSCPGHKVVNGTWFGLSSSDFGGRLGYADFLFSLTDNPFLFRQDKVQATRDFLDNSTESVDIILLFYTPNLGMTSVLTVTCDFVGTNAASVDFRLDHYEILEGTALSNYLVCQILVLVNIGFMLLDVVLVLRGLWCKASEEESSCITYVRANVPALFKLLIDFVTSIMVLVFVAMRIPSKTSSSADTQRLIGELSNIAWDSQQLTMQQKTGQFFSSLSQFLDLINLETNLDSFCSFILFVSLLRVIQVFCNFMYCIYILYTCCTVYIYILYTLCTVYIYFILYV